MSRSEFWLAVAAVNLGGLIAYFAGPPHEPVIPMLAMLLLSTLIVLAAVVTWGLLIVKALLGESFKLPWIGELAER